MKYRYENFSPQIAASAYIAPDAVIIGQASIASKASVWFKTVVRADINSIEIGEESNIQDNCTVHVTDEHQVKIGRQVTAGHGVILHGCTVEDNCLIAMGAVILDGAVIGKGSLVAAGAVVAPGTVVPPDSLVMGLPAKVVRKINPNDKMKFEKNWQNYVSLSKSYKENFTLITEE